MSFSYLMALAGTSSTMSSSSGESGRVTGSFSKKQRKWFNDSLVSGRGEWRGSAGFFCKSPYGGHFRLRPFRGSFGNYFTVSVSYHGRNVISLS